MYETEKQKSTVKGYANWDRKGNNNNNLFQSKFGPYLLHKITMQW